MTNIETKKDNLKKEILDALNCHQKETGKDEMLSELDDINEMFYFGVKQNVELEVDIELRGSALGDDIWLQAEYYSKTLQKTIVFDYDWASSFDTLDEFAKSIVETEFEVIAFEKRISLSEKV